MKINYLLITLVIILFAACKKSENSISTQSKAIVNGQAFNPGTSNAKKVGSKLIISFTEGTKKIELVTSDAIVGTYTIVLQSLKSAAVLSANIAYTDGSTNYLGTSGSVSILKNSGGVISGTYTGTVTNGATSIEINSGSFTDISINVVAPITDETAINDSLTLCYSKLDKYIELEYMFDAVYSNSIQAPNSSWSEIYNHNQTQLGNNAKIYSLWSDAYDIIYLTNQIINSSELVISDQPTKSKIVAQAKIMRAYLFYELMIWFGEIPLDPGFSQSLIPRNSLTEVLSQINQDATDAAQALPASWSAGDKFRIPLSFAKGLLARKYLYIRSYSDALSPTQQIVNSAMYALDVDITNFTSASTEIIWGFDKTNDNEFNDFFNKGSYIPVLRYTEITLIHAEILFHTGDTAGAINQVNTLNARGGRPMATTLSADELFNQWNTELVKEGSIFTTLMRFNKVLPVLQGQATKLLLPVPLPFLNSNVNLTQNPGY